MVLKYFLNAFTTKDFTNGIEPINALRIHKPMLGVRKPYGNDMDESNPCGHQVTHFVD
jgi:hypothetical protein